MSRKRRCGEMLVRGTLGKRANRLSLLGLIALSASLQVSKSHDRLLPGRAIFHPSPRVSSHSALREEGPMTAPVIAVRGDIETTHIPVGIITGESVLLVARSVHSIKTRTCSYL